MVHVLITLAVVGAAGCVNNPVGSARRSGIYESKAVRSAESALSAVETVQLLATTVSAGNAFGAYSSVAVDEQEDALTEIIATFRSIQPSDATARAVRVELGLLLSTALDHLAAVRLEIRRGRLGTAEQVAAPLADDAHALDSFVEDHS